MDEKFLARLFAVLAVAVTAVWLIGYLAPIVRPSYVPPPELNIVMMAVIGIFAALYNRARHPDRDSGGDKPPESDRQPGEGDSDDE